MFSDGGEEADGKVHCEGEGKCLRWDTQKGTTYEEKSTACTQCPNNCLPPLLPDEMDGDEAVTDLVDEIAYLIAWEDAGFETDWTAYSFPIMQLFVLWREAEHQVKEIRSIRHSAYIRAMITAPQNPLMPPAI